MAERRVTGLRIELFVRDPARSQQFYASLFGLAVRASGPSSRDYVAIECGGVRIGLGAIGSLPPGHRFGSIAGAMRGAGVEIVLEVEDLEACERRARSLDATIEPLRHRPWGLRDFRVLDPDGYYLRVTEAAP